MARQILHCQLRQNRALRIPCSSRVCCFATILLRLSIALLTDELGTPLDSWRTCGTVYQLEDATA